MSIKQKVAMVIDALPGIGGAEKVLMAVMELYPDAPIYTLVYNRAAFAGTPIAARRVIPSVIDRLPKAYKHYRKYLPLMPGAIERFDLGGYDLVLSLSYAVAHGIAVQTGQKHLSYTFTPMRYAWCNIGLDGVERPHHRFVNWLFGKFRKWDVSAVERVDRLAAVSGYIANCTRRAYRRESTVIYPPVEVERFSPQPERGDYYVTVSRLVAHKRVDLMVQAFNLLGLPLLVVGDGPERSRLERRAQPNVRFLGFQPDEKIAELLGRARSYISAGKEDFGIAAVEAQAAGCPVIAYRRGGALETVIEDQTGLFFDEPVLESLVDAVECFEGRRQIFEPAQIAASVQRFNRRRFLQEFAAFAGNFGDLQPWRGSHSISLFNRPAPALADNDDGPPITQQ
jgi:glycosyltransferase involved in cell wall biosynthesis